MTSLPAILFVSRVVPDPTGIGVQQRAWSSFDALSKAGHLDVVLALRKPLSADDLAVARLLSKCRTVHVIDIASARGVYKTKIPGFAVLHALCNFGKPYEEVSQIISRQPPDCDFRRVYHLAFCFRVSTYKILRQLQKELTFEVKCLHVDFDDIESVRASREIPFQAKARGREVSVIARIRYLEIRFLEKEILNKADYVSVCSATDQKILAARGGKSCIRVIPNSVSMKPPSVPSPDATALKLLFVGTMNYHPNEDAVIYFCSHVYPRIQAALNNKVILYVVGRYARERIRALNKPQEVVIVGGVEDVTPYYADTSLVIVPIRFGGGTRIKILEAYSYGRPVISTSLGAEGLEFEAGREIILADSEEEFAEQCIELLRSPARRHALAAAGRCRVNEHYSYEAIQSILGSHFTAIFSNIPNGDLSMRADWENGT